jgi:hypothetical protein
MILMFTVQVEDGQTHSLRNPQIGKAITRSLLWIVWKHSPERKQLNVCANTNKTQIGFIGAGPSTEGNRL